MPGLFFIQSRSPRVVEPTTWRLEVHRGIAGIERLRDDWDTLVAGMSRPRFFHFRQWYESYLYALASNPDEMTFCLVRDSNDRPAALMPLKQERRSAGPVKVRTLELPRHEHMYLRDILISDAARETLSLTTLTNLLRQSRELKWDILCLWHVLDDSPTMAAYRLGAPSGTQCTQHSQCFHLPVEPWEQFTKRLGKNFRKSLRAARRRADEIGTLTAHAITTLPELDGALREFVQIEASGWKGAGGTSTAIAADPQLVRFYQELTHRFAAEGRCHIHLLRDGDKTIAVQFVLLDKTTAYTLKTGYDESYSRLSPGHLLDESTFTHYTHGQGITEVNLASDAPYLESWKPLRTKVYNVYAFNRTPLGFAAATGMNLAKRWQKRNAPA